MTVGIELPATSCTVVTADCRRIVEPGEFALLVGPNSRATDLLSATFRIGEVGRGPALLTSPG
jgi:beta-glucosidase